mmetsp:Transcript_64636/g.144403  ORF Transcript_64636/g.144403 Transcript_64636/m.144403 type:complete len:468 (-) Transcript_64636:1020-2423(-)
MKHTTRRGAARVKSPKQVSDVRRVPPSPRCSDLLCVSSFRLLSGLGGLGGRLLHLLPLLGLFVDHLVFLALAIVGRLRDAKRVAQVRAHVLALVQVGVTEAADEDGGDDALEDVHARGGDKDGDDECGSSRVDGVEDIGIALKVVVNAYAAANGDGEDAHHREEVGDGGVHGHLDWVCQYEGEGVERSVAEGITLERDEDETVIGDELDGLFEAVEAAHETAEDQLQDDVVGLVEVSLDIEQAVPYELADRDDGRAECDRAYVETHHAVEGLRDRDFGLLLLIIAEEVPVGDGARHGRPRGGLDKLDDPEKPEEVDGEKEMGRGVRLLLAHPRPPVERCLIGAVDQANSSVKRLGLHGQQQRRTTAKERVRARLAQNAPRREDHETGHRGEHLGRLDHDGNDHLDLLARGDERDHHEAREDEHQPEGESPHPPVALFGLGDRRDHWIVKCADVGSERVGTDTPDRHA